MNNNLKVFNRVFSKTAPYGLVFISSNGGTGKTTYLKFRLLRNAIYKKQHFHIYMRYLTDIEKAVDGYLKPKESYSKRMLNLLEKVEIQKQAEEYYIVNRETNEKIAMFLSVYNQAKYKPIGNNINAKVALFDEILAENGGYTPQEINRFNRLVFTMARANEYKVICLYNNTNPDFPYFSYFGGISYNTHVAKSGAMFYYFIAEQYTHSDAIQSKFSIQSIIKETEYKSVYCDNSFMQFPNYYENKNIKGYKILFYVELFNMIFKVREVEGKIFIDRQNRNKLRKSKKIYSLNLLEETNIRQMTDAIRNALTTVRDNSLIKTNNINDTIFVKAFNDRI